MKTEVYVVIEQDDDGYYIAAVPTLRGCRTRAKSLDILMKRIQEAIVLCLDVEAPASPRFVGIHRVTVTT